MEMDFENRIVTPEYIPDDDQIDVSLRPKTLTEYIGQEKAKENLSIYIEAARLRRESLDHVLLSGPPGLGKTTLANIISNEMGVNIRVTSGPAIEKQGDLAALLTNGPGGVKSMHVGKRHAHKQFYDCTGAFPLPITIDGNGNATFPVQGGSLSVWITKEAYARQETV